MLKELPTLCVEVSCLAQQTGENMLSSYVLLLRVASTPTASASPHTGHSKYPVIGGAWGGRVALWDDDPDVAAGSPAGDGPVRSKHGALTAVDKLTARRRPKEPRKLKVPVTAATAGAKTPRDLLVRSLYALRTPPWFPLKQPVFCRRKAVAKPPQLVHGAIATRAPVDPRPPPASQMARPDAFVLETCFIGMWRSRDWPTQS